MSYQVEICANSVQSAINAEIGGAGRIELCDNLWEGGTTPSMATIELVRKHLKIEVFVLIRPRGGDFVYTDLEFEIMNRDIQLAKEAGVDGIVSGVLNPDGSVDLTRTAGLIELSRPLFFTYHRAFDLVPDPEQAMEDLIRLGANRILTSGQKKTAAEGLDTITRLLHSSKGRIVIMPGGGIGEGNIRRFYEAGCREFHFSAKTSKPGLARYSPKVPMNSSADIPENELIVSDPDKIQRIKRILDEMA